MTTTPPPAEGHDAVTLESLREWAKRRADELEITADDHLLLPLDRWKVNGMHRAFMQVVTAIDAGRFPE